METSNKRWLVWLGGTVLAAVASIWLLSKPTPAHAADLGSAACCADLEERVAELEATAARKGNRKISLRVYGVVDETIIHASGDGIKGKWGIGSNSNVESFIGVAGEAIFMPHVKAGYVLEIGVGGYNDFIGAPFSQNTNGVYTKRSFGYVKHDDLGQVTVGLANQATDGITELSVANVAPAARMLSIRPLVGPQVGEALDIFDGGRANLVRYDTKIWNGAQLSASWAPGGMSFGGFGGVQTDDAWDVALRWAYEGSGIKAVAGLGYRNGISVPTIGILSGGFIPGLDPKVLSGSLSVMHVASGLFVNLAAGELDPGAKWLGDNITAYGLQAGIETKIFDFGKTTMFGEWADSTDHNTLPLSYWGLGGVQGLVPGVDVYASYRQYQLDFGKSNPNVDVFMAGMKVDF